MLRETAALLTVVAGLALLPLASEAATSLQDRASATDEALSTSPALLGNDVLEESPSASSELANLTSGVSALASGRIVSAYHANPYLHMFSVDAPIWVESSFAGPGDLVTWDGTTAAVVATGVLRGNLDALTILSNGDVVASFDEAVDLSTVVVFPEDLARQDGANWLMYFDGSTAGVPSGANLDAAHALSNGNLLLSFDVPVLLGGSVVMPEDLVEWNGASWELAIDASSEDAAWSSVNRTAFHAVASADDNCSGVLNPGQENFDGDAEGDACDSDDDNDGLSDVDEAVQGTNPLDPDSDDDGLNDGAEISLGTSPLDPDSDDDGLEDGAEVALGTDPLDPDTDDDDVCDGDQTVGGQCETAGPDNCPFIANPGQANSDGLPAGDDCQCGDVNGDLAVDTLDLQIAREELVEATLSGAFDVARCDFTGAGGPVCEVDDLAVLERLVRGASTPLENACPAYGGP